MTSAPPPVLVCGRSSVGKSWLMRQLAKSDPRSQLIDLLDERRPRWTAPDANSVDTLIVDHVFPLDDFRHFLEAAKSWTAKHGKRLIVVTYEVKGPNPFQNLLRDAGTVLRLDVFAKVRGVGVLLDGAGLVRGTDLAEVLRAARPNSPAQ